MRSYYPSHWDVKDLYRWILIRGGKVKESYLSGLDLIVKVVVMVEEVHPHNGDTFSFPDVKTCILAPKDPK